MIFVDKMKNLRIYKTPMFLPTLDNDKKKKSAILMLTPNYESSKKIMNSSLFINRLRYESYYIEKDVSYYINQKMAKEVEEEPITEEVKLDTLPKYIYHISYENHDGEIFSPRKYDNDNVKNKMERHVARVCFADSITRCLYSIFPNGAYDADFYVHIPEPVESENIKVYKTTNKKRANI